MIWSMLVEKGKHDRDQDKLPAGHLTDAGKGLNPACTLFPLNYW